MPDADHYTRPERYAELQEARKLRKRVDALRRDKGLCVICAHREQTCGIYHCKGHEDRQRGACEFDKRTPKFEFDPATIERFRNAA